MATEMRQRVIAQKLRPPAGIGGGVAARDAAGLDGVVAPRWAELRAFCSRFCRDRAAVAGGAVLLLVLFVAVFGRTLSPYNPLAQNSALRMAPPGTSGYL